MNDEADEADKQAEEIIAAAFREAGMRPTYGALDNHPIVTRLANALRAKDKITESLRAQVSYAARLDNAQEDEIAKLKAELEQAIKVIRLFHDPNKMHKWAEPDCKACAILAQELKP